MNRYANLAAYCTFWEFYMIICQAGVQELYEDCNELPPYAFTGIESVVVIRTAMLNFNVKGIFVGVL